MKWIHITDKRKPKDDESVLMFMKYQDKNCTPIYGFYDADEKMFIPYGTLYDVMIEPEWWLSVPEYPKAKKEK